MGFFGEYIELILEITMKIIKDSNFSGQSKLVISEFLHMICDFNKKMFTKNNCAKLKLVFELGFKLACTPTDDLLQDDEDDDFRSKYTNLILYLNFLSKQHWIKNY